MAIEKYTMYHFVDIENNYIGIMIIQDILKDKTQVNDTAH